MYDNGNKPKAVDVLLTSRSKLGSITKRGIYTDKRAMMGDSLAKVNFSTKYKSPILDVEQSKYQSLPSKEVDGAGLFNIELSEIGRKDEQESEICEPGPLIKQSGRLKHM